MKIYLKIFVAFVFLSSCYYDNLEEMNPGQSNAKACDTAAAIISYSTHIRPIMNNYCSISGCHTGNTPGGGISLDNYDDVKNSAMSGKLYGSITWDGSSVPMPKGATNKISDCDITMVRKWIANNYTQ